MVFGYNSCMLNAHTTDGMQNTFRNICCQFSKKYILIWNLIKTIFNNNR